MKYAALALLTMSCATPSSPTPAPVHVERNAHISSSATFPPPEAMVGISGLAKHEASGRYFAVSERERTMFPISIASTGQPQVGTPLPIHGVPDGLDLESMAFIDANTIVFGTESQEEARTYDAVLYATMTETEVTVLDERTRAFFEYEAYGIRPDPNRGVEGLCTVDARIIAVGEQVIEKDNKRLAPLQVYDPLVRGWRAHELVLTSEEGKISALTCLPGAARTEVYAIERHYAVVRVVRFEVPLAATEMMRIEAKVVADLSALLGPKPKNFEGLAVAKGGLYLISDNSHGGLDGPTTMLHLVNLGGSTERWGASVQ